MKSLRLLLLSFLFCPLAFAGQQVAGNLSVSGNVGIGTVSNTSIALPLDVLGTARMTGFVLSGNSAQSTYVLTATNSSGNATWQAPTGGGGGGSGNVGIGTATRIPVYIGTSTIGSPYNNVMDSNGNVGIGTISPTFPLDVEDIKSTGYTAGSNTGWSFDNIGDLTLNGNLTLTGGGTTIQTTAGTFTFLSSASLNFAALAGQVSFDATTQATIQAGTNAFLDMNNAQANDIELFTQGQAGIYLGDQTYIGYATGSGTDNSTPGLLVKGNVGIGSTNPGQALDVQGTLRLHENTDTETLGLDQYHQSNLTASAGLLLNSGSGNIQLNPAQGDPILLSQYNTNSNVGIDLGYPVNTLDVNGSQAIGSSYAGVYTAPSNSLIVQDNIGVGTYAPESSLVAYNPNSNSTPNSTTPSAIFKANGNTTTEYNIVSILDGGINASYGGAIGGYLTQNVGGGLGLFIDEGGTLTQEMIIDNNGNVGIGMTKPVHPMEVGYPSQTTSQGMLVVNTSDSGNTIGGISIGNGQDESTTKDLVLGYNTTADHGYIQSIHNGSAYTPLILQPTAGNVGIGTYLGDSLLGLKGSNGSTTVGPVMCIGKTTLGQDCAGKCTSISTDTCACTCL